MNMTSRDVCKEEGEKSKYQMNMCSSIRQYTTVLNYTKIYLYIGCREYELLLLFTICFYLFIVHSYQYIFTTAAPTFFFLFFYYHHDFYLSRCVVVFLLIYLSDFVRSMSVSGIETPHILLLTEYLFCCNINYTF